MFLLYAEHSFIPEKICYTVRRNGKEDISMRVVRFINMKFVSLIMLLSALSMMSVMTVFALPEAVKSTSYVWEKVDNQWTCVDKNGSPVSGWVEHDEHIYYLDKHGVMETGWIKYEKEWYYLNEESGELVTSKWVDNYYVNSDGVMSKIK